MHSDILIPPAIILLFSEVMRNRSCALHCDSEEQFIQLAQATMDTSGVFYDEKLNRRVMGCLSNSPADPPYPICLLKPHERHRCKEASRNPFLQFDFSIEIQVVRQEKEQLERMRGTVSPAINIAILCNSPSEASAQLSAALGLQNQSESAEREINLLVYKQKEAIYKMWFLSKRALRGEGKLVPLYLSLCSRSLDFDLDFSSRSREDRYQKLGIVSSV